MRESYAQRKTALPGERSVRFLRYHLRFGTLFGILCSTTERIKYITEPPMRCKVRQKPCEMSAIGSLNFKKDQIMFCKEWITVLPLTATTDTTGNGGEWKNEYSHAKACVWKVGELTLIYNGREKNGILQTRFTTTTRQNRG